MSYLVPDRAPQNPENAKTQITPTEKTQWEFAEIWVDPWLSPPYILMLVKEQSGTKLSIYLYQRYLRRKSYVVTGR
jgi:hypothetical protein